MAIASSARLFSRRLSRIRLSSSSSNSILSSSPSSADEALMLSRHLSSASLATRSFDHAARFEILPFNPIYSTSNSEEQKPDLAREELVPKAPIKPPPRPFKLNSEHRELVADIGYKVVDRYTEEDFGHNKRPKSFAIVQIGSHQFKVSPNDLIYTEKLKYCDINDKVIRRFEPTNCILSSISSSILKYGVERSLQNCGEILLCTKTIASFIESENERFRD